MQSYLHAFIIAACTGIFVHEVYRSVKQFSQKQTAKTISTKTLSQVEFLHIQICLDTGYTEEVLKTHGYATLNSYIRGVSEGKFIGWAGNGSLGTNELFSKAYIWKNWTDVIESIRIGSEHIEYRPVVLKEHGMLYPDGKCFSDDGSNVKQQPHSNMVLIIVFKNISNRVATISVTDPNTRTWQNDPFSYTGNVINKDLDPNVSKTIDIYNIQVTEIIDLEIDPEAKCRDYSSSNIGSYGNCVTDEIQGYYSDRLACHSPWFGNENKTEVCEGSISANDSYNPSMVWNHVDQSSFEVWFNIEKTRQVSTVDIRPFPMQLHHYNGQNPPIWKNCCNLLTFNVILKSLDI